MVKRDGLVITPGNICTCCEERFVRGDQAVMVVRIPGGHSDTLCLTCWLATVASACAWLGGGDDESQDAIGKRLREAQRMFELRKDRLAHLADQDG